MRKIFLAFVFLAFSLLTLAQQALSNDSVIKLVKAGIGDDLVVQTINSQPGNYSTGADDIVALKQAGASDRVIGAMVGKNSKAVPAGPVDSPADPPKTTESSNAGQGLAGGAPQRVVSGSRIFVAPMQGNLDGFISAEILKQRVPLVVVTSDTQADFVMTGMNIKEDDHWYNAAWGGKDKNEASVRLIGVQSRAMLWAGDAGDRSLLFSGYRRGGLSKVAERLVRQMDKDLGLKH